MSSFATLDDSGRFELDSTLESPGVVPNRPNFLLGFDIRPDSFVRAAHPTDSHLLMQAKLQVPSADHSTWRCDQNVLR